MTFLRYVLYMGFKVHLGVEYHTKVPDGCVMSLKGPMVKVRASTVLRLVKRIATVLCSANVRLAAFIFGFPMRLGTSDVILLGA